MESLGEGRDVAEHLGAQCRRDAGAGQGEGDRREVVRQRTHRDDEDRRKRSRDEQMHGRRRSSDTFSTQRTAEGVDDDLHRPRFEYAEHDLEQERCHSSQRDGAVTLEMRLDEADRPLEGIL